MGSLIRCDINAAAGQELGLGEAQAVMLTRISLICLHVNWGDAKMQQLHIYIFELVSSHPLLKFFADIFMREPLMSPWLHISVFPPNIAPLPYSLLSLPSPSHRGFVIEQVCPQV